MSSVRVVCRTARSQPLRLGNLAEEVIPFSSSIMSLRLVEVVKVWLAPTRTRRVLTRLLYGIQIPHLGCKSCKCGCSERLEYVELTHFRGKGHQAFMQCQVRSFGAN